MKGLSGIIGQAKKMQEQIVEAQKGLSEKTVEASSGGGMVTVVANGRNQLVSVKIDPDIFEQGDVEMFEDLVTAAVNEALRRSQEMMSAEMSKISGNANINIPDFLKGLE